MNKTLLSVVTLGLLNREERNFTRNLPKALALYSSTNIDEIKNILNYLSTSKTKKEVISNKTSLEILHNLHKNLKNANKKDARQFLKAEKAFLKKWKNKEI